MEVEWGRVTEDLPTECSRGHETVNMINFGRGLISDRKVKLDFFCPSCHQKLEIRAKISGDGKFMATGYDIKEEGSLDQKN